MAMARLEAAAEAGDHRTFFDALKAIDWQRLPADDWGRAVRLALAINAPLTARRLAAEGAERYPDHGELPKMARILAPPKVVATSLPPDPSVQADMDWLKKHGAAYREQWVAVKGGQLLGAARSLDELVARIGDPKGKGILLTRVY